MASVPAEETTTALATIGLANPDDRPSVPADEKLAMSPMRIRLLNAYFILLAAVLLSTIVLLWPQRNGDNKWVGVTRFGLTISHEIRVVLLVMAAGALGSYVHAASSFVTFVGNRRIVRSWTLWYVLRPLIGVGLALIMYFLVRGGILAGEGSSESLNPFAMVAMASLTGMFSKEATMKLDEVFDTLFAIKDPERQPKLRDGAKNGDPSDSNGA